MGVDELYDSLRLKGAVFRGNRDGRKYSGRKQ